jgi:NADH:ubiquinone oxidoreductase subunit H
MRVGAVVMAGILALLGVRSFSKSLSVRFEAETLREHFLYSLHVTARICVWFALAGAFLGFAVLDQPDRFRWYVFVPLGLAALQVLAALALWRSPSPGEPRKGR